MAKINETCPWISSENVEFSIECRVRYSARRFYYGADARVFLFDWFIIRGLKLGGLRHSLRMRRTVKLSLEDHNVSNY